MDGLDGLRVLLIPPVAFGVYLALAGALAWIGRRLAGHTSSSANNHSAKRMIYASGEAPSDDLAVPGYRPFFQIALFFAVLHLGALMVGSAAPGAPIAALYVIGLVGVLAALALG